MSLSEIEIRQIKDQAIRDLVDLLCAQARNPDTIGRRVLALRFRLSETAATKRLTFAKQMQVSRPAATLALERAHETLYQVHNSKSSKPLNSVCTNQASEGICCK